MAKKEKTVILPITKRDGRIEEFNSAKIVNAISKANDSLESKNDKISKKEITRVAEQVVLDYMSFKEKTVETVQDDVEDTLIKFGHIKLAKEYIKYRSERTRIRNKVSERIKEATDVFKASSSNNVVDFVIGNKVDPCVEDPNDPVDGTIPRTPPKEMKNIKFISYDPLRERLYPKSALALNANLDDKSFGGRKGAVDSYVLKKLAFDELLPEIDVIDHNENRRYKHDADSYALGEHNCDSVPLSWLLSHVVYVRQTAIRPAGSLNTALQLIAVYFQIQSLQQFGGVAATAVDWLLVPYFRMSLWRHYFDVVDCIPFLNVEKWKRRLGFDKWEAKKISIYDKRYTGKHWWNLLRKYVAKKALKRTLKELDQGVEGLYHNLNSLQSRSGNQLPFSSINYGTCTLPEGQMVIESILKGCITGTGPLGQTAIFPCGIFKCDKDINLYKGTPNYNLFKLALVSTSKRFYPNYANNNWSVNNTAITYDRNLKRAVLADIKQNNVEYYNKLVHILCHNPDLAEELRLDVNIYSNGIIGFPEADFDISPKERVYPDEETSTMGCRTYNGYDINYEEVFRRNLDCVVGVNGLTVKDIEPYYSAAQKDGRGNICPETIILPTLAMEAKTNDPHMLEEFKTFGVNLDEKSDIIDKFMAYLDIEIARTRDSLIARYKHICSQSPDSATFMWQNKTMVGYIPEQGIESAMKHGTLAVGQLGLAETLLILIGKDHTEPAGMVFAKRIENLFNKRCKEFKESYKLNFGVYYSPAESLCFTAMNLFRAKYGEVEGITTHEDGSEKKYFTNSMHVPVYKKISVFDKIDIESELTGYSNAGCITYVEFGKTAKNNPRALEQAVVHAMEKDIPYFAANVDSDSCMDCGYIGSIPEGKCCPKCGSDMIMRPDRVTGYLNPNWVTSKVSAGGFNEGKQDENRHRENHTDMLTFDDEE